MNRYLVGIEKLDFCDQPYLRDRDEWVNADTETEAIAKWIARKEGWLRSDDDAYIKIFEVMVDGKKFDNVVSYRNYLARKV